MRLRSAKKRGWPRLRPAMWVAPLLLVLGAMPLAGCANFTEDINPANWGSDDTEPVPGEEEDFPNLGSVPDAPQDMTSIEVIEQVQQSLLADSANAQYTATVQQRVDDETSPEPMPEVVEEVVVEEEVVIEEEVETDDGTVEEVVIEEDVQTEEIIEDDDGDGDGAALEVVETEDVALAEPEPADAVDVAEEETVAEVQPAAGVVAIDEVDVVAPEPVAAPVMSDDDALPPERVARAVPVSEVVEEVAVEEVAVEEVAVLEPEIVEPVMATETVEVEAVEPAPPGQATMSENFDAMFEASGPGAEAGGSNAVPEFVVADIEAVSTPAPTITATGYQSLVAIIRFDSGSSVLDADDRRIVKELAEAYRERGGRIRLAGYASRDHGGADDTDEMLINFNMSVDRAVAVADELVRQGVASDNIEIDAKGDAASVQVASGELDEAGQRRVEVYFTN
jgi:outer membrane protein OmpA-like peptidoglycan-associated protein